MKSNRGPDAIAPPPNYDRDSAYFKAQQTSANAYAWAQREGTTNAGGVGGSWGNVSVTAQARQPDYSHQATPSITISGGGSGSTMPSGGGGTAIADGSYEKQLIMELCPPGGMKAEPPPDKLAQFARLVANLNPDLVCPALLDCLEEGQPWIIRAKALCVMEACIVHGKKPGAANNAYADFFHACSGEISPLVNHNRQAIREPARRVLTLLGMAEASQPSVAPAAHPPAAAPVAPMPNLLDFDEDASSPPPVPSSPAPSQQPSPAPPISSGGDSLFGGLKVQSGTTPSQPQAPPSRPPPPPSSGNLLGDLTAEAMAVSNEGDNGGLFGDVNVKESSNSATNQISVDQASYVLDGITLKTPEKASEHKEDPMLSVGKSGSAFGFINQDSVETPAPASASKDSFDPLKNTTPNTAKQMMQFSPAQIQAFSPQQMQALAYQQMMMQQQMQMAQMLAMQQQQRGGATPPFSMQMPGHVVMQNPAAARTSFAFMDGAPKKDDKSFDFIKDAMTMEKKK